MNRKRLLAFLCLLIGSVAHAQQPSTIPAQRADVPLRIIDVHTHASFSDAIQRGRGIPQTEEQYFKEWKEAGVVGAVAHTSQTGTNYFDLKKKNVIYCAGIGDATDLKEVETGLRSGKYGCMKIYLGYVHRFAYDAAYEPVYKLAEKYDVAVVFHTGDTYSTRA